MDENSQTQTHNVELYDIVDTSSGNRTPYMMNDVGSDVRNGNEYCRNPNNSLRQADSRNHQEDSSNRTFSNFSTISEEKRKKLANYSCLFGILFAAVGGGLVTMFIVAKYSPSLQVHIDYEALVVPGFIVLFIGVFFLVTGIYFTWVHKRRTSVLTYADEREAGFHEERRIPQGYVNQAMVPDNPPSYMDLETGPNVPHHLPVPSEQSTKLPSYGDAVKINEKDKPDNADDSSFEPLPPPYQNDQSTA